MASVNEPFLRPQLLDRKERLERALATTPGETELTDLLASVDAALARIDDGSYGLCRTCHDPIEADRLLADPLLEFCLDHLTVAQQRALEEDLERAARIQRGLLPDANLVVPGWEVSYRYLPAGAVSGDYCDLVRPEGGGDRLYFMFGDVSGKGVAAAILMSQVRAIFRGLLGAGCAVEQLVTDANRLFRETALSPYFATLVCGRATPTGDIEICNAGHCPPLVLGGDGARSVDPTGFPLGVFYAASYRSTRLTLRPGESLVLYTDGLTEANDHAGLEYGVDRLVGVLLGARDRAPRDLVAACLADLTTFLAGAPRTDDITLMVIRRTV